MTKPQSVFESGENRGQNSTVFDPIAESFRCIHRSDAAFDLMHVYRSSCDLTGHNGGSVLRRRDSLAEKQENKCLLG